MPESALMTMERCIDVRDLEPPEPLEQALAAAHALASGEYLRMLHRREPYPLYQLLAQDGFRHLTRNGRESPFEILIWRAGDRAAEAAVFAGLHDA